MREIVCLAVVMLMFFVSGCGDNHPEDDPYNYPPTSDVAPVDLLIDIVDATGRSLLEPDSAGSIVGRDDITVEFKGKTYTTLWNWEYPGYNTDMESRAIVPKFWGLRHAYSITDLGKDPSKEHPMKWQLILGEFFGHNSFDYELPLTVGERTYIIRIAYKVEEQIFKEPYWLYRSFKVYQDGKLMISKEVMGSTQQYLHLNFQWDQMI